MIPVSVAVQDLDGVVETVGCNGEVDVTRVPHSPLGVVEVGGRQPFQDPGLDPGRPEDLEACACGGTDSCLSRRRLEMEASQSRPSRCCDEIDGDDSGHPVAFEERRHRVGLDPDRVDPGGGTVDDGEQRPHRGGHLGAVGVGVDQAQQHLVTSTDLHVRILRSRTAPAPAPFVVGIAIALVALSWPARTEVVLGRLIGMSLVLVGLASCWRAIVSRPTAWVAATVSTGAAVTGGFLVVDPVDTERTIGHLIGVILVGQGLWNLRHRHGSDRSELRWRLATSVALGADGASVLIVPTAVLSMLIIVFACTWIFVSLVALRQILEPSRDMNAPVPDTGGLVRSWFAERPRTVDSRETGSLTRSPAAVTTTSTDR